MPTKVEETVLFSGAEVTCSSPKWVLEIELGPREEIVTAKQSLWAF